MSEILFLSFIAALICLDVTAFGQLMISRPIVCGPVFGYLLGDIKSGLWIGMIIELIWIGVIPMGAAIPLDIAAVSILTVSWGMMALPGQKSALILAAALAVPAGFVFKRLEVALRYFNIRIVHWVEEGVWKGREERIAQGVLAGLLLFFIKSFIFFLVLIPAGCWFTAHCYSILPVTAIAGLELSWELLPVAGFGMVLINFRKFCPN